MEINTNKAVITKEYIGDLWEQQAWETDKEYSYFIGYMNMAKRSHANIPNVTSPINVDGSINQSPLSVNYISNISVKNKWIERCNAFDLERQNELQSNLQQFKGEVLNNEIDIYNTLFSKYKHILESKSNNTITIKELNGLVRLGMNISDIGRRIVGLPEKYNAGVIEQNINNTNTQRTISIVEVRTTNAAYDNIVVSNSPEVIEGDYSVVADSDSSE